MHVSGISGGSQLPSQPSNNWGTMAYSLVLLEELANKAGALGMASIDASDYERMNAEVEAFALQNEIHLFLTGDSRDVAKALAAANELVVLIKQYDLTSSQDPHVKALATHALKSFITDENGTVTGFKNH